jgi:transcriptional regulator with XRE-family HTH domain
MPQKIQIVFGQILRRRREEAGLTQESVAHEAGLSRNYVGMVERGERVPTIIALRKLALAIDTTMSSMIQELEQKCDSKAGSQKGRKKS